MGQENVQGHWLPVYVVRLGKTIRKFQGVERMHRGAGPGIRWRHEARIPSSPSVKINLSFF